MPPGHEAGRARGAQTRGIRVVLVLRGSCKGRYLNLQSSKNNYLVERVLWDKGHVEVLWRSRSRFMIAGAQAMGVP